jgi:integrase
VPVPGTTANPSERLRSLLVIGISRVSERPRIRRILRYPACLARANPAGDPAAETMAYIKKTKTGYRVQVERMGVRRSATLPTKVEATNWGAKEEAALLAIKHGVYPRKSLADAIDRYVDEVSSTKRGERMERLRLEALKRDYPKLVAMVLSDIRTPDLAAWRDSRLKVVTAGSVQRDINILSNLFIIARDEWKWLGESPMKGMRRPGHNPPRTRRIEPGEVKLVCRWLGYVTGKVETKQQEVAFAFLLGLRTAMRASEILSLSDDAVDLARRVATVNHKMQHLTGRPRQIPLSSQAVRLLRAVAGRGSYFTLSSASLDTLFRKARDRLLLNDLHFHDSRAEALTRLSRKVDVMTLARISGHKDLRTLMDSYYRESAADIAARLP